MKNIFKSIRVKLFFRICIVMIIIFLFLIVINSVALESYFYYIKTQKLISTISELENLDYSNDIGKLREELQNISLKSNFDIVIKSNNDNIFSSGQDYVESLGEFPNINYEIKYNVFNKNSVLYSHNSTIVMKTKDKNNDLDFLVASSELKDGNKIYLRMPISIIKDSILISTQFLEIAGIVTMFAAGVYIFIITKIFTKPIVDLREMTSKMKNLDFSEKYIEGSNKDEIDELGKNINDLSETLEETINKLRKNNMKLERDIEEKSKIDEMRKQFISDVSHELKTPIALIQGYAEGLIENVNKDEESKNFYSQVILDEANKMDNLVKRLLELIKLEYDGIVFNDNNFDIVELIKGVITNSKVMLAEQNIKVEFNEKEPIYVFADDFYIEQVVTNYFTNAIKNIKEKNGKKVIKIDLQKSINQGKLRVKVFNTGDKISEENITRIWNRFFKVDESRNREKGGTGIGLALVKAIMTKSQNSYGVKNKENGVEFFFEVNYSIISGQM